MYNKIIVPLDGSTFAEQALCHAEAIAVHGQTEICLLYTSPSPRDRTRSRMPSSA